MRNLEEEAKRWIKRVFRSNNSSEVTVADCGPWVTRVAVPDLPDTTGTIRDSKGGVKNMTVPELVVTGAVVAACSAIGARFQSAAVNIKNNPRGNMGPEAEVSLLTQLTRGIASAFHSWKGGGQMKAANAEAVDALLRLHEINTAADLMRDWLAGTTENVAE